MNKGYWLTASVLFLLTAWLSSGYHQADEHFQILEFAAYKLGLASAEDLPWEFNARMRPALQPFMAYLMYRLAGWGEAANPFTVALLLRLLSAGFTLGIAWMLYRRYHPAVPAPLRWLLGVALLFHWFAYYNGVRFSSENWSGLAAVAGFLLYPLRTERRERVFTPDGGRSVFWAGVLFGLAFLFRYQIALLVAGFALWLLLVHREAPRRLLLLVAGGLATLLCSYPLTYWLYGEWTLPAWNYLAANLIEGKAATYGTRPWYAYVTLVFLRGIPPLSLVYLIGFATFCYAFRRDPVAWMSLAFVIAHSLLARKDIRFLYPLTPLVPVYILGAIVGQRQRLAALWQRRWVRQVSYLVAAMNVLLLGYVLSRPAAAEMGPAHFLYAAYPEGVTVLGPEAPIIQAEGALARFYHRPQTVVDTTGQQFPELLPGTAGARPLVWVARTRAQPDPPTGSRLVYSDRPAWVDAVDVFGWLSGQKWWYLYEVPGRGQR